MTATADDVKARAQALLDARLKPLQPLSQAGAEITALQQQLRDAQTRYANAHAAAVKVGWTRDELRHIGVADPEPAQRQRRSRRTARAAHQASNATPAPAHTD